MKLSLSAGAITLLLSSVVDASSQFRNASGSGRNSAKRRRTRSAIHRDDYSDADYHRSLSSATWEGGSGHSSSPSLNYEWDIDESSASSFYDIEDVERRRKKRKRKRDSMEETERILQALEKSSREEELEQSKRSRRKKSRTRKTNDLSSPISPKKSTKKRRRNKEHKNTETLGSNDQSIIGRIHEKPSAKKDFASKPATETSKSSPSVSQTKSHPDRTQWEVPSYSHKTSTMMDLKRKESALESRKSSTTALPRPTTSMQGRPSPTARNPPAPTARRTKPTTTTTATTQSSTLGSSTTPWVRKFLAARPKDRLLPLPRDYISDNFNLAQLPPIVERIGYQAMGDNAIPVAKAIQQHRLAAAAAGTSPPPTRSSSYPIYRRALRSLLEDPNDPSDEESTDEDQIIPPYAIQKAAEALYLMLHARFVISPRGLEAIRHVMALDNTVFGKCPRSCCKGAGLLPYGYSNDYTSDASVPTVSTESRKEHDSCCHRYCPSCGEVWISWESKTDGCAWGPSWCHLFLLAYGSQVYAKELEAAAAASQAPQPVETPPTAVRSFLQRGIGQRGAATTANNVDTNTASDDLSHPTPSVFGFRVHPSTDFGRPFNEASLRGGSNE